MEYIISAIWIGLELLSSIFFNGAFLPHRRKNQYSIIILILLWTFVGVYTNLGINILFKQVLTISVFVGISAILYRGKWFVHLVLSLICYIFITIIDTLVINGMCTLLRVSYEELIWRKFSYVTLTTVDKMLSVFSAWLIYRLRNRGALGFYHSKWLLLSILFPLVSAMMFAILFYTSPRNEDVSIIIVIFSGILLIANVAMLYIINSIEKTAEHEHDARMLRQQILIQAKNYSALKESYSVQRKMTHEFERHVQVIRDLLDHNKYETAQDYVMQLQSNRTLQIFSVISMNPVVDVVLNQKYQVAQENNIKMSVKVNDLSSLAIQTNELVVLLSNLLDNAIEACVKLDSEREIVCKLIKEESIYISIRNTSLPVDITDGEIPTTKHNVTEHGYGLQAIKYILIKLGAEYSFEYSNGWFQFVAEIPA